MDMAITESRSSQAFLLGMKLTSISRDWVKNGLTQWQGRIYGSNLRWDFRPLGRQMIVDKICDKVKWLDGSMDGIGLGDEISYICLSVN